MRGLWVEGLLFEQLFTNRIEGRFELLVDFRGYRQAERALAAQNTSADSLPHRAPRKP